MLYTVKEVAEQLKVSPGCVYSLMSKGQLSHLKIGSGRRTIRVAEDDLKRYLDKHRRITTSDNSTNPVQQQRGKALKHLRLS